MSIHTYNILKEECKKSFAKFQDTVLGRDLGLEEKKQARLGFYFFIIEKITGQTDYSIINKSIVDTNFRTICDGEEEINAENDGSDGEEDDNNNDFGIDAIYIDESKQKICLFNFKYRDTYTISSTQGENELFLSNKFLNNFNNESLDSFGEELKHCSKLALNRLKDLTKKWTVVLYFVSNDENILNANNAKELKRIRDEFDSNYCCDLRLLALQNIPILCGFGHKQVDATFTVDSKKVIVYETRDKEKSYSFCVPLSVLVKITCDNPTFREEYPFTHIDELAGTNMDDNSLYENVRNFLTKSKYNDGIKKTISGSNNDQFYLFNNGITLIATKIEPERISNFTTKYRVENLQIVNGGQTVKTIFKYLSEGGTVKKLSKTYVLMRIFKIKEKDGILANPLGNNIARYTNSQNPIDNVDLKSLDPIQLDIEQILHTNGITYLRKRGKAKDNDGSHYKILSSVMGQIIWSIQGFPYKAANQKSHIFDETKEYNNIFSPELDITKVPNYALKYFELSNDPQIKQLNNNRKISNQECFYLLHAIFNYNISSYTSLYSKLKEKYDAFKTNETTCDRPYIKSEFFEDWKAFLDNNSI